MSTLYALTEQFKSLLEMIENGEYEPAELNDTLEGLEGEIEVKADGYAKVIRELDGQVSMLKAEIDRLSGRKSSIENSVKVMKDNLQAAMTATGKIKFKTDLFSFNIQKNPPRVVIDNPKEIPERYLVPQEPKIDTQAIRAYLSDTGVVPTYAHLEQGESLRIR
jgi:predicted nuclease with TOPRIM domain